MIIWLLLFTQKFKLINILDWNVQSRNRLNRMGILIYSLNSFQCSHIFSATFLGIWLKIYNFGQWQFRHLLSNTLECLVQNIFVRFVQFNLLISRLRRLLNFSLKAGQGLKDRKLSSAVIDAHAHML